MKVSTKRTIAGVSTATFIAALHWAGGFNFDERGGTLVGALAMMVLFGAIAACFPFEEQSQ